MKILRTSHHQEWMEILRRSFLYDWYHLPFYHAWSERRGEGIAQLFLHEEDGYHIAMPLLLRPVHSLPGIDADENGWMDATSVYGYAGPVASHRDMPARVLVNFQEAMRNALQEQRVITVFSRLHPLIPQQQLLAGLGEHKIIGPTVSMDLTLPAEAQLAQYRKDHRHAIRKLHQRGAVCVHDDKLQYMDAFIDIYQETMRRVAADSSYYLDREYFDALARGLGGDLHLFVVLFEKQAVCGGLFIVCDGVVQYHLSGTLDEHLSASPAKLLLDHVRSWATAHRYRTLHLGGGVGSQKDCLFEFKAGFSGRRHDFSAWHWVLETETYAKLRRWKARWNEQNGLQAVSPEYFPEYRSPTLPLPVPAL